jgi:1,4-alpha-glucan branching enzyme/maltooligosyltrehalose trehalohydrolase
MTGHSAKFEVLAPRGLRVRWHLGDGSTLRLLANFSSEEIRAAAPAGQAIFASSAETAKGMLNPWSVVWTLEN